MASSVQPIDGRTYGVTEPVTKEGPSSDDLKASEELKELLRAHNLYETNEGKKRREDVLESLNRLLQQYVRRQAKISKGLSDQEASGVAAKLLTFGSYRLGIVAPDSDIDVLFLCPKCVTRESFFSDFYNILGKVEGVSKLQAVPDAYTPVIKLYFYNISIDILFANLDAHTVSPNINVLDDKILRNMSDSTVRSINGCRVASFILDSVPNKDNFRTTLRFIKLWAARRKIYSTVVGYLGGVAWAILTARVCQLYPNCVPNQLVEKFFRVYSIWNWKVAVTLCKIREAPNVPGFMAFKVWDPRNNPQHLMPIITPAFPSMNSTHNVTATTKRVMIEEMKRARDVLKTPNLTHTQLWERVLEEEDVFAKYKHFLVIKVYGASEHWEGWIGSRMRFLIKKLETLQNTQIRPLPGFFKFEVGSDHAQDKEWDHASSAFFAFKFEAAGGESAKSFDIRPSIRSFREIINGWSDMEKFKDQIHLDIKYLRAKDLPDYVQASRPKKRKLDEISGKNGG